MIRPTALLTLALFARWSYGAETTLYFPGFDPQPLSVDYISTDLKGNTAWEVHGTTDASGDGGFPGVMTLVEGPNYASLGYTFDTLTLNEECNVTDLTASCAITSNGAVTTTLDTSITKLTAAVGKTAPTPPPGASSGSSPSPGSGMSSPSRTPTSSSSGAVNTSSQSNFARSIVAKNRSGATYALLAVIICPFAAQWL